MSNCWKATPPTETGLLLPSHVEDMERSRTKSPLLPGRAVEQSCHFSRCGPYRCIQCRRYDKHSVRTGWQTERAEHALVRSNAITATAWAQDRAVNDSPVRVVKTPLAFYWS